MNKIRVKKVDLLDALRKNREGHRAIFEEALEGYHKKVVEELERRLADARANKRFDVSIRLVQPEDHTEDYDRAIEMLEMDLNDEQELSTQEFAQFVQDDWGWRQQFLTSNAMYSTAAMDELGSS